MVRQVARQTAEAPARKPPEAAGKTVETDAKVTALTLTPAFEQMTGGVERSNLKGERGKARKALTSIEGRLESLSRMFAADKDMSDEEDTEEEEN